MLTLYVCPRRGIHYQPTSQQIENWLISIQQGELVAPLDAPLDQQNSDTSSEKTSKQAKLSEDRYQLELFTFAPGLGVVQLFNNDARDALLPAELTFESLNLSRVKHPHLLPPERSERIQCCPQCGDEIAQQELERVLQRESFTSFTSAQQTLDQMTVFCHSCQDEILLKHLEFEPESAFACFWITLVEVGSSRLNPVLLRDWESKLGCGLRVLVDQHERDLDEIDASRRHSELWQEFEEEHGVISLAEQLGMTEASGRNEYRRNRYLRRARGDDRKQRSRTQQRRGRSQNVTLRWDDDE